MRNGWGWICGKDEKIFLSVPVKLWGDLTNATSSKFPWNEKYRFKNCARVLIVHFSFDEYVKKQYRSIFCIKIFPFFPPVTRSTDRTCQCFRRPNRYQLEKGTNYLCVNTHSDLGGDERCSKCKDDFVWYRNWELNRSNMHLFTRTVQMWWSYHLSPIGTSPCKIYIRQHNSSYSVGVDRLWINMEYKQRLSISSPNYLKWPKWYLEKIYLTCFDSLVHVPSTNIEEEAGFIAYIAARHQGAIEIIWLHFWGAVMPSIISVDVFNLKSLLRLWQLELVWKQRLSSRLQHK